MRILARLGTAALLASLVSGRGAATDTSPSPDASPADTSPAASRPGAVTAAELATATRLAREEAVREEAHLTSASVVAVAGTVRQPNTGHRCDSGRLLRLRLVGTWPHIVTGGTPVRTLGPLPYDGGVRTVLLTADAETGLPCLIGVSPQRLGPVPGATTIVVSPTSTIDD